MSQDSVKRKKIIGAILAAALFIAWIFVDMYIFPLFGITSYTLYEVIAYGSWIIITLVCFGILVWAGWVSTLRESAEV
jgi:hypothetical protein